MPRYGDAAPVGRVRVDVVAGPMAEKLAASSGEFTDELTSVQELNLDGARQNWAFGGSRLGFHHELVGVANVVLEFGERLALTHDPSNFLEPADVPGSVLPVFQRERAHKEIMVLSSRQTKGDAAPVPLPPTSAQDRR